MAKKAAKAARKDSTRGFLLQFLYGAAIGLCGVHSLMAAVEASASFGQYLFCVAWMVCVLAASAFLQILLHEGGHLVCGLLSGYRFVSYRIGSWMVQRENGKLRVHRFSLAGTAGQCLMAPPDITNGKIPYKFYNAGGVLTNLLTALLAVALAAGSHGWRTRTFWEMFCVMGLGSALTNGIPLRVQGVANDGANVRDLGKDPAALQAFWAQLKVNEMQAGGVPLREMPEAWFTVPAGAPDNLMLAAQAMLQANRLMDAQHFAETARAIDALTAQSTALLPLHRNLLLCDRLTCALLTGEDAAPFAKQWNSRELQAFRKQMKSYPSVLRTEFAVALLVERNTARAEKIRARLERVLCTYPYAAEAAAERSLLQKLEALGK